MKQFDLFCHEVIAMTAAAKKKVKPLPKLGTAVDDFDSWALTAGILLNKVLFFSNKRTRL